MSPRIETRDWPAMYKHQPRKPPRFPAGAADAWERLSAELAAAPDWSVPCRDDGHGHDWITENDRAATARAVEACGACPLMDACRDFAEASRAPAGVWGGHAYSVTTTTTSAPAGDHREEQIA